MSEKFAFIAAEKASKTHPPVTKMCGWLQVSTSGFYDHNNAVESDRARRRAKVARHVQAAFDLVAAATASAACTASWPTPSTPRSRPARRSWSGR